jgi:hypothetical protein
MFHFCFNDCIPKDGADHELVKRLSETLTHYDSIKNHFPGHIDGVITDRLPSETFLNNTQFTLADCIGHLDRELKKIALSNFNKYPVENYCLPNDIDRLLALNFKIFIDKNPYDAINAMIVAENNGVLFTLLIHSDLKNNFLTIKDDKNKKYQVLNLFGDKENTLFVKHIINRKLILQLENFDKLKAIVGECSHNTRFKKDFECLPLNTQDFLIKEIQFAIDRNAKTRFYPDDKLIKNVTPDNEKQIKIFELRIFSPLAIRMYFFETSTKVYLGSIEGKPKKKEQTGDILNAVSIIKELILLEA